MRVQPLDVPPCRRSQADATSSSTWRRPWVTLLACTYVGASVASSIYFLTLVDPSFRNDLWWANYEPTTDQALLIDLFNLALATRATGTVDLLSPSSVVDKRYNSGDETTAAVSPTYVRQLSLAALSIEVAIVSLRQQSAAGALWLATQFCWVDLNHTFELAHTASRQRRCVDRYVSNGAVYLETVLRNQVWEDFLGVWTTFDAGIQAWLEQIPAGQSWLAITSTARAITSVDREAMYWRAHNMTTFQLQWQNGVQMGVTESMLIENALGLQHELVTKNIPFQSHLWTSVELTWLIPNDLGRLAPFNVSLIRSAANSFLTLPFTIEAMLGLQQSNGDYIDQVQVFRTHIGPFLAVDTLYVAVPAPLVALYHAFQTALHADMSSHQDRQAAFDTIPTVDFTPSPWPTNHSTRVYYGGNPLCLSGRPLPYVQEAFSFGDGCSIQPPLRVAVNKYSSLFATLMMDSALDIASTCALHVPELLPTCRDFLTTTTSLSTIVPRVRAAITRFIPPVLRAVLPLNISLVQFATNSDGSDWTLLRRPILTNSSSSWDVFGWTFLFDWVEGMREVVSFEGDVASFVLVSAAMPPNVFISSAQSNKAATRGLYCAAVYVTIVLGAVALGCAFKLLALGCRMPGSNFVWFNPVVGSIWIGRPLVFVRGLTAMLVLSTAQLNVVDSFSQSRFASTPRRGLDTAILAGEATWVLHAAMDFCTVWTHRTTAIYGPMSCVLSWCSLIVLDVLVPLLPNLSLDRSCSFQDLSLQVKCASGRFKIGSRARLGVICSIQALVFLSSLAVACVLQHRRRRRRRHISTRYALGVADYYFLESDDHDRAGAIDGISSLMAGYVPFVWRQRAYTFDIKLWVLHSSEAILARELDSAPAHHTLSVEFEPKTTLSNIMTRVGPLVGMAYAIGSIVGSVSYIQLSEVNLANDMFWASFNVTGAHAFLANWLNAELIFGATSQTVALNVDWINMDGSFHAPTQTVVTPLNHGALLQYSELNTLLQGTIQGLRAMDACKLPWIFTPYCFVDFSQRWEMANTAKRQRRCQTMTTNGAVFLESLVRNTHFAHFYTCWGSAYDVAVGNDLKESSAGLEWMTNVSSQTKIQLADEVLLWQAYGIDSFDTQWQNFKLIGLVNSYSVWNALGISYPFTLQSQKTAYRWNDATTLNMYWGFGSDLYAVVQNASGIAGTSLIRSSPRYAFANTTFESVVIQNGTLHAPSDIALALVRDTLGPFGSIDMYFVACPVAAKSAVRSILHVLRQVLFRNTASAVAYFLIDYDSQTLAPVPKAWTDIGFQSLGGSPLCSAGLARPIHTGMFALLSWENQCSQTAPPAALSPSREDMIASVLLANLSLASSSDEIATTCAQNAVASSACLVFLHATVSFVATYMLDPLDAMTLPVVVANAAIRHVDVELIQLGQTSSDAPVALYRYLLLDPSQPEFTYFAWLFVMDWIRGNREAVRFQGDVGTITLLTEPSTTLTSPVNVAEYPAGMVVYVRNIVAYVTMAMMVVAGLVFVYIGLSRGQIELLNLLELQRVGAIVWIGRPLLFARSLTAVALLSTCTLALEFNGSLTYFQVADTPWYKTLLAANEVTWLVAITNDIAMAVTKQYTMYYTTCSSIFIWVLAVSMSFISPVTHRLTIDKQCHVPQVDFQIVCTSGVLYIGHVTRLATIAGVVFDVNLVCYVATRVWFEHLGRPTTPIRSSIFLYAGARYLFATSKWVVHDVYYMDRMSAALNGILTLRGRDTMYCLDVKLWRTFQVDVETATSSHVATPTMFALPLRLDAFE
ncbi:Aste57867_18740 [Aphanomyces stellatus]|uniref:Aste57867_18740 protein n=1 Tax=Aphanomyces stellatus TaxID=120398 RepID=A0A485LB43_9STRA|nr:hypothetical protein As57867_018676 [Aphanomyces stellatus]VFT95474.1 Aste57867_18740 [Aphanomyces stellatus]